MNLATFITLVLTASLAYAFPNQIPNPDLSLNASGSLVLDTDLHPLPSKLLATGTTNTRFNCKVHLCNEKYGRGRCTSHIFLFNRTVERAGVVSRALSFVPYRLVYMDSWKTVELVTTTSIMR